MAISTGDSVVIEYTGRLDDGSVFDSSREEVAEEAGLTEAQPDREYSPLTIEVGEGQVIEGMDEGLVGLEKGDEETLTVPPEKGYGERSEENVQEFDAAEFEQMLQGEEPEEGMHVQTQQGGIGELVEVDSEIVRVDFNHDLAGETLEFEIEIVDIE